MSVLVRVLEEVGLGKSPVHPLERCPAKNLQHWKHPSLSHRSLRLVSVSFGNPGPTMCLLPMKGCELDPATLLRIVGSKGRRRVSSQRDCAICSNSRQSALSRSSTSFISFSHSLNSSIWFTFALTHQHARSSSIPDSMQWRRRSLLRCELVPCHSSTNSKRRLLVKDQLGAMIFELEERIHGSTTSIYNKSLCTVVVAVLRIAALR
jgi:hypothetical protein